MQVTQIEYDHRLIDNLLNSRIRFAAIAYLLRESERSFVDIRECVNTTRGNLAIHLRKLEAARYVECIKCFINRKPMSFYRVTGKGRTAFYQYSMHIQKFCIDDITIRASYARMQHTL
jgi:DNA-binding MarR family transcriptional regulator